MDFFVQESAYCRGIVPRVKLLADELRCAGRTVAWVAPGYSEPTARDREHRGDEVAERYARSGGPGTPRERLWSGLAVADEDLVAEKTAYSAFLPGGSDLPDLLAGRDIDTVVVGHGHQRVRRGQRPRRRDPRPPGRPGADACAAMRDRDHNATSHTVHRSYGDVRPTADVVTLIRAGIR